MAYQSGKTLTTTWTPISPLSGTAVTLPVQDSTITDGGDKLDATNSTTAGRQALIAGIGRFTATVKILFDSSASYYLSSSAIRFGQKGLLAKQMVASGAVTTYYSIYCMITSVATARPCNGLVTVDVSLEEDYITGAGAYPTV